MLVVNDPFRETDLPVGAVATIGNFDGVHRGHQAILRGVIAEAHAIGAPAIAITFLPHPLAVVAPERAPSQILTSAQKEELLREIGLDALVIIPFTADLAAWPAEQFIEDVLISRLRIRGIRIGQDFCFGAGRRGNLEMLERFGAERGFSVGGIDDVRVRGIRVSSSIIRDALRKGALRCVTMALGRSYSIDGRVETGRKLGRKIGVPTINIAPLNTLFPAQGVYITTTRLESFSRSFQSVTNIGVRPTLYENYGVTIESHILDFASDVYGDHVRLYFHELIRRERQFQSALELTNQIRSDIERSRRFFRRGLDQQSGEPS